MTDSSNPTYGSPEGIADFMTRSGELLDSTPCTEPSTPQAIIDRIFPESAPRAELATSYVLDEEAARTRLLDAGIPVAQRSEGLLKRTLSNLGAVAAGFIDIAVRATIPR